MTTPVPVAPRVVDTLRIVAAFLREDSEVSALLGGRVYTVLPRDKAFPLARLTRFGGTFTDSSAWLDRAELQLDIWADRQVQVSDAARCCVQALTQRLPGSRPGGVVTASRLATHAAELDPDYEPVKHRARLAVSVFAHP
ncbi:tail completion protein gp17 [Actinomadura rayongensis]|uniref:DUF3168 domain-containing protein n=1 Tax=Actinomadura rayongensis TaxID=1429076 RepID=A0A6I4WA31_9ACTN|nr:DUF3168 domain-containing protein [Actinomadura rayongensis]MXQ67699.1 DUF3168 domain-containing protein [Actinomadura rayongensis]